MALSVAGPAQASCAEAPADSPFAFTGTVVAVADRDRVATVRLDDGSEVVVHGGPDLGGSSGTSLDRRYVLDGRYEFHPRNASSPYADDACTATRQLAGPTADPVEPARDRLPGWLPVDEQAGPLGYAVVGLGVAVTVALLGFLAVTAARRRRLTRHHRVGLEG